MNITRWRIPTGGRQTSWLFTTVAEKLYSGLPRTASAMGSERDLNPRPPDFKSDALTTRPRRGMLIVPIQLEEKICFHVISWSSKIKQDPQDFLSHLTSRRPNCAYYLLTFRLDGIAVWKWSILNFRVFTPHDIKRVVRELSRMFKKTHLCCKFILKQVYVSEQVFMWKLTGLTGSFFLMYASVSDLSNCFPSALFVSFRISETCRNEIPHKA